MTLSLCPFASGSVLLLTLLAAGRPAVAGEALAIGWRTDIFSGTHSAIQRLLIGNDRSLRLLDDFEVCPYMSGPGGCLLFGNLTAVDLNGDGADDIVTPAQVLLNDGDAHFTPAALLDARGSPPDAFLLFDLDRDGDLDIVISGEDYHNHVVLNDGGGLFHYAGALGNPPADGSRLLAAGDLNGDELPDLFAGSGAFFGLGDGRFSGLAPLPNPLKGGGSFSLGKAWIEDIDGAAPDELIVQGELLLPADPLARSLTGLFVLRWNGTTFSDPEFREPAANPYLGLDLIDIDGDGLQDKVERGSEGGPNAGVTSISWGRGALRFETGPAFQGVGPLLAEDLDGDGLLDLALGPLLFWGTGPRQYDLLPALFPFYHGIFSTGSFGARFLRGDSDRDGRLDVSDPIATLQHLFQGRELACLDAADADDSGAVNLSDAIVTLSFLFLGGPPAEGFETGAAIDLTPDALGCAAAHGPIPEVPVFFPPPGAGG